ncbi:GTP 3',8-cyclase MoaA [Sulfurospirillum oryzae]|uniref:GTP 3',8-cyclase MoaA n=1 Tax=Sulfurospirillum oryzae TaxID=2976535 RepID=UPI0021E6ED72|nr:GTP 3',8-cyclase MoaA [Sulfurospirillum oryzae]
MLVDGFGRNVTYLRISVTERCNFRCQYCMPEKPFSWVPKENLLNFEELFLFVKVAIDEGITKIRITGGEPLLRTDLDKFIAMINNHKSGLDLALTTNGFLLKDAAQKLKNAGLQRVNISLDSLKPDVAGKMAQKDVLAKVQAGIEEALRVGLKVKINMVPIKGINADEVLDVLEYAKARGMSIRFIEYMENTHAKEQLKGLSGQEVQDMIAQKYHFKAIGRVGPSPAHLFEFDDGYVFGIIDPHKHDFCEDCNRIRLTAEGMLIPCLYFDEAMSIKDAVHKGDVAGAAEILKEVLRNKPEKNKWSDDDQNQSSSRAFYETGG